MFTLIGLPLLIYLAAAVLPAILLMRYVYLQDTVEKEPMSLLTSLLFFGVVAAILSGLLERLGKNILQLLLDPGSPVFTILFAFLVVAMVEEGTKFMLLRWRTWGDRNFNYRFDGIVYSVFLSLGFAAYENVQYVLHYGLSVALPRAILAVPGHLVFSVIMGLFYGRAKLAESRGQEMGLVVNLWLAYAVSVLLHGFYDACAMIGTPVAVVLFILFVLVMYLLVFCLLRRESATDEPV